MDSSGKWQVKVDYLPPATCHLSVCKFTHLMVKFYPCGKEKSHIVY